MPLRILQVASGMSRLGGGTEKHILDISVALAGRGHSVTLACSRNFDCSEHAGLRKIAFEARSPNDCRKFPGILRALTAGYDVVHTHFPLDYFPIGTAARLARIPAIVMTRHMPQPFASRRNAYIGGSLLYDRIIAVSGFIRGMLVESGARPERIELVYNGVAPLDPDPNARLRLREELGIPRDAILIGAAGRVEPCKGFDVLLKAVRQLGSTEANLYCAIFGSGRALESLRTLACELQIDPQVRLPGFRTDVHNLWRAADIAVIPSVWPEPFGYAALEALSAGCPVVASRVGGLPEVLSSDTAIFIEPGDIKGLAFGICNVSSSPELRIRMQHAARQRSKLFALENTVTALEELYAHVLYSKRQRVAVPNP